MNRFSIGQRVRICRGQEHDIGREVIVIGAPYRMGEVNNPRSSWYGQDPNWIVYPVDVPGAIPLENDLHFAYPEQFLEPIWDGDGSEKAEWTEHLRKLCGLPVGEDA